VFAAILTSGLFTLLINAILRLMIFL